MSTEGILILVFQLIVLVFSVVIHEVSHGAVANRLGDPTAKIMGRLTLNPAKHLDPFGSVILPLILSIPLFFGQPSVIFGWAKPVPYNPYNLKNPKTGGGIIAAAGPLSNIFLALIFGVVLRFVDYSGASIGPFFEIFLGSAVLINVALAVFNLLPIPPLDGSKVLFTFLPDRSVLKEALERYGLFILLIFIFFGFGFIVPVIRTLYSLIVGS